ncbi:unnamed protein product [Onchocerca flexuosa]|uniref:Uncharacterized protein n=1 Tax=Onchocerca flexuosa TaxID=387005 RepID=A0A183HTM9_9BILA|nr:unnamed protein product [Onchocerca flexuosa]
MSKLEAMPGWAILHLGKMSLLQWASFDER